MDGRDRAGMLCLAMLSALWVEAVVRAFSLLFLLNFSIHGPDATAALSVLLAAGFLLVLPRPRKWTPVLSHRVLAAAAVIGLAVSWLSAPLAALAGALLFLATSLPLARSLAGHLGREAAVAAALGVVLHQAARAFFDGAHLYGSGVVLLAALGLAWVALSWHQAPLGPREGAAAPLVAFLWAQAAFAGSTQAVSAWVPADAVALAVFGGLGLWAGAVWGDRVPAWLSGLAALAGAVTLLWTQQAPWVAILVLQAGLAGALRAASGRSLPVARDAVWTGTLQLVLVALLFLHVAAVNWAFVGFLPEALTRGRSALYLFVATMALPVLAARTAPRSRPPAFGEAAL